MGLKPLEAHGQSITDSPYVAMFARYWNPANRTRRCVVSKYDGLVTCINDALDLDLEVLAGVAYEGKGLAPVAGTRLHGVLGYTYSMSSAMKSRADSSRSQAS